MKRCLVIHGSPRRANTYKATNMVMEEISKRGGWNFEEIYLKDLHLPFCLGCFTCILQQEKKCPHRSIMGYIEDKMLKADALIVSAPIYIMHVNAETKNFFDHLAYAFHRPRFFGKQALVISTTAAAGARNATKFLRETLYQIGYNHAYELPFACWGESFEPKPKDLKRLRRTAGAFARDLERGKIHNPSWYHLLYHTAFRAAASAGAKDSTADHLYWKDKGLLDLVYPHKTGLIKGFAGATLYRLMKRVMTSDK